MMNPACPAPTALASGAEDKWWENPCGGSAATDTQSDSPPEPQLNQHLDDLLTQIQYNLKQAEHLKDQFVYANLDKETRDSEQWSYPWLENRARTKWVHRNEEIIKELYRVLQILGVAFQHLIDEGGFRAQLFKGELKGQLQSVLCEIKEALTELRIQPFPVDESVMPDQYKNMTEESERSMRDFIIFNSYRNTLEWTVSFLAEIGISGNKKQ